MISEYRSMFTTEQQAMNHPDGPAERAAFLDEALAYDVDDYQAECDEADTANDVIYGDA